MGYLYALVYLKAIVQTLSLKVRNPFHFLNYYSQLHILSNVLGPGFERATFILFSLFYLLFVQTLWICVCGFGKLDLAIYIFFATYAFLVLLGFALVFPILASTGEVIQDVHRKKLYQIKIIFYKFKTKGNEVYLKKFIALRSIRFNYGGYYPLGRQFSRNIFDNIVQHLFSMVLMFDLSGKRLN